MKKALNRLVSISVLSLLLIISAGQKIQAQDVAVSYQTFYDDLSPYGQWINDPQYGNVWVPNESSDFRPYGSRGHWVMTDYGNTWVSDDPWGWACYHYGRWTYDPYYGWLWIPGYEWAPAWVCWRYGGGECGWAPLGPGAGFNCPDNWWVFVGTQYIYSPDCFSHWRGPHYNHGYIGKTSIINNYYVDNHTHVHYNFGPRADVIEKDTHQPVQVYHVSQTNRPGAPGIIGNNISLYRPAINKATANTARPGNVVAAPRQIGNPQAATNAAAHQPQFKQDIQKQATGNNAAPRPANTNNQPRANNNHAAPQPHNNPRQQNNNPRPVYRPQPATQPRPMPAPRPAPAPRPMPAPRPAPAPRPMPAPEAPGGRR